MHIAGVFCGLWVAADALAAAASCGVVGATGSGDQLCTAQEAGAGRVAGATSVVVCMSGLMASG